MKIDRSKLRDDKSIYNGANVYYENELVGHIDADDKIVFNTIENGVKVEMAIKGKKWGYSSSGECDRDSGLTITRRIGIHINNDDDEPVKDVLKVPVLDSGDLNINKRIFLIYQANCAAIGGDGEHSNIIGLTNDLQFAKSMESVFCGFKEIKLIKRK